MYALATIVATVRGKYRRYDVNYEHDHKSINSLRNMLYEIKLSPKMIRIYPDEIH